MEADADIKSYLEHSEEYLKLKVFKLLMVTVTTFTHTLLLGALALLALFVLSIAASIGIGQALGNPSYGYGIVGLVYIVAGLLCYVFRDKINRPILRRFSKHYFDD